MARTRWGGRKECSEYLSCDHATAVKQRNPNYTNSHLHIQTQTQTHTNIHAHACLHTRDERVLSRTRHANTADLKTVSKNSLIENDSPAAPPPESPSRPVLLCIMPAIPSPSLASCVSNTRDIDVDRKCRQRQTVAETQRCKESHSV